jgi:hypothetical protein
MKKVYLMFFLVIIMLEGANGQITGFKIKNKISSIKEGNKDKIDKGGNAYPVYKTIDIMQYNYLDLEKKPKELELMTLEDKLYKNSIGADEKPTFDPATVSSNINKIKQLREEISIIEEEQDSLYYLYTKDFLNYKRSTILRFGPLRSRAFFDMVYGDGGKDLER